MTYGYARCSVKTQNEDRQLEALTKFGVPEQNIIIDKASGKDTEREGYQYLKRQILRKGDTLVIKELDSARYLLRRKKNSIKNRLRFNGTLVNCYEIILPKDDSVSDDGCMTLEYILTHFEGVDES